jgi:hypothetical protein
MRHHAVLVALCALASPARAAEPATRYADRWFYVMPNLQVDTSADEVVALIRRAAKGGYTGVVIADYKFNVLDRVPDWYFKNAARVRQAAKAAGIEIIPAVFPVGYSNGLLAHDPNLAEGLPVTDAPFVVRGGEAVLVPDAAARFTNGGLEQVQGDRFAGFALQDDPGRTTFADRAVVHGSKVSCRMQDFSRGTSGGNCRLAQRVKVRPHACYRFSCWVKTRDLNPASEFRVMALGADGRQLSFFEGGVPATQDWSAVDVVFNSLDEKAVLLYAGVWGGRSGTLWVTGLKLEELALVNVLRRPGCPLRVASADGRTAYKEGKDYRPVRDEKLGQVPFAGEYEFHHPGARLRLAPGSRIREGQRLRVSWYHPVVTVGGQVMCCLTEPKVYDILRDQVRRVDRVLHPRTFLMSHDEIRVAGWCHSCQAGHQTPGELLAANVKRCTAILKEVNPKARVVVWSDMFDPHHNAVDHYYLVNGTLAGSWKGLRPEVVIANWNSGKARESLRWFADRGHRQVMAGYYDSDLGNLRHWQEAARGVSGVVGFMYTTWAHHYGLLEAYGKALTAP